LKERKKTYKKGQLLFHKTSKEKIMFGNWAAEDKACCLDAKKNFIYLTRAQIDNDYQSYSALEKKARETRHGQCW
jgi:hypothetical protein